MSSLNREQTAGDCKKSS